MIVYDGVDITVHVQKSWLVRLVTASGIIYLAPEELASIAEAVAAHLKREAELEYEKFAWPPTGET